MGWAKNRDCEKCKEWVGQCPCYEDNYEPDLSEMMEEAHQHFDSIERSNELPF